MKKKVITTSVIVISLIATIFCLTIEIIRYYLTNNIPNDISITVIENVQQEGELKLFYDSHNNRYWLFRKSNDKNKLVMFVGGIRGKVLVNVIDINKIEIIYDYIEDEYFSINDKRFEIDLSKNQTHNVSIIYKLLEYF